MASRTFTAYFTQHGPIVARENGKWIAEALMNRPIPALEQSWLRTKATDLASYMKIAELKANSSNNTLFADDKGNIAFLVPQFIPRRDNRFDYTRPVDGSNPATAWQGLTPIKDMPNVINPPNGWVFNTNDWPWTAAGKDSPKAADYPQYMDSFGPNPRSHHALRMLTGARGFTKAKLIADAFDSYQTAFARLVPILVEDYDALPANDPQETTAGRTGRRCCATGTIAGAPTSIPTTVAVYWLTTLGRTVGPAARASGIDAHRRNMRMYDYIADKASPKVRLAALARAVDRLDSDFGTWGVPWGQINRYQRLDDSIHPHFTMPSPASRSRSPRR